MGIWDKFKPREKHESFGDVSMPSPQIYSESEAGRKEREAELATEVGARAHPMAEALTIRIHQDTKKRWRITVVDADGKTLLIRAGFGFADWYEARAYANRIAAARFEIETTRDDALE